ncbi:MAG: thioester domain-containing protein [Merdibacter sp.]
MRLHRASLLFKGGHTMTRRLLALVLCIATLLSLCTGFASAANTVEDALWVRLTSTTAATSWLICPSTGRYIPEVHLLQLHQRCRSAEGDPGLLRQPEPVRGSADRWRWRKYLLSGRGKKSDPKVMGIIANGYPTRGLAELKLDNKYQAYYATKMAFLVLSDL